MKKFFILGAIIGIASVVGILIWGWKILTITDPYVVKRISSAAAPVGKNVGYSLGTNSIRDNLHVLSIVSSNDIVVVADPGASFRYEVLWLVERPRKVGASTLMEYKYEIAQYADQDPINPPGSQIPPKIQRVADGYQW